MLLKILKYFLLGIALLLVIMLGKTIWSTSKQVSAKYLGEAPQDKPALQRLSEMLRFRTISFDDSSQEKYKLSELNKMYEWLRKNYPIVHEKGLVKRIGIGSCIITFEGTDKNLQPALFLAHLDVVPVDTGNGKWKYPPFSGMIQNDTLYGRGTLDDKSVACAMLEAMEKKLAAGNKNKRTIIFAFGHDEETGGRNGAMFIANYFLSQKIIAEFICDEGFGVMEGLVPGVSKPVAIIGIAEKGYMSVKLSVDLAGGHSAMPKNDNATAILTNALAKVNTSGSRETITESQQKFFSYIAPEAAFGYRFLFSNLWIASPLVKSVLRKNNKAAATIRTSRAITILKAGEKDNTLPSHAEATINFRILPGETVTSVFEELKQCIDDERVHLKMEWGTISPSPTSGTEGIGWNAINSSIRECFENVVVAPSMVITGTDCKNYTSISKNIYRFVPMRLNENNLGGIHGDNERIAAKNYFEMIRYYAVLFGKL